MHHNARSILMGVIALISIVVGGLIAWTASKGCMAPPPIPVLDLPVPPDTEPVLHAPDRLSNGAVKSVTASWPDGGDRSVEYYLAEQGGRKLVKSVSYFISGREERELEVVTVDGEEVTRERGWFESGEPYFEYFKKGDALHGVYIMYWETGFRRVQGHYRDGRKDDTWHFWNQDGVRVESSEYRGGVPHGRSRVWGASGMLRAEGMHDDGRRVGVWTFYDPVDGARTQDYSAGNPAGIDDEELQHEPEIE